MHLYSSDLFRYDQKGNGVILIWEKRFLFVVGKEEYWEKTSIPWVITYTNTGGHVEPNETVMEATRREVMEELGCHVELLASDQSLYCDLEECNLISHELEDEISPILIYNSTTIKMSVSVYLGRIHTEPRPHQEVPALLFLPPSLLSGGQLTGLIKAGAILKEQVEGLIPRHAILKPFGSASLLAHNYHEFIRTKKKRDTRRNR